MIARDLRAARVQAGLSQVELAKRMRRSQTLISLAEAGRVSVGERYVLAVLKACGLPPDWKPERTSRTRRKR
jgi:transcriptional regulator with XRE-family HTH domain